MRGPPPRNRREVRACPFRTPGTRANGASLRSHVFARRGNGNRGQNERRGYASDADAYPLQERGIVARLPPARRRSSGWLLPLLLGCFLPLHERLHGRLALALVVVGGVALYRRRGRRLRGGGRLG